MKYFQKLKTLVINFTKKGMTPHEISIGFAVGILVAFVPIFGTHTIIAISLSAIFRLNPIIVLLATQVSNPITYPFQLLICAEIGNIILKGYFLEITFSKDINLLSHYLWPIVTGSIILGITVSSFSYFLLKWILNKRNKKKINKEYL
ncbi:MAG: DUF2062 domain-containing protein [Nitrospirae bacterium]|jgi:uncharacterized protein (DUF2062 family)|nr:DUF2062 domain-containing protein [Nitrospirota bacterium]